MQDRIACAHVSCVAVPLRAEGHCYVHADTEARILARQELDAGGDLYFASGLDFNEQLFTEIMNAIPRGDDGKTRIENSDFSNCLFREGVSFRSTHFVGGVQFDAAEFVGAVSFGESTFEGTAHFRKTVFNGEIDFASCTFEGSRMEVGAGGSYVEIISAFFEDTRFVGEVTFADSEFRRSVIFNKAYFEKPARFERIKFSGNVGSLRTVGGAHPRTGSTKWGYPASLVEETSVFYGSAVFVDCNFSNTVRFDKSTFGSNFILTGTVFSDTVSMLDVVVHGGFEAEGAVFNGDWELRICTRFWVLLSEAIVNGRLWAEVQTDRFDAPRIKLAGGGTLALACIYGVDLSEANLSSPLSISGRATLAMRMLMLQTDVNTFPWPEKHLRNKTKLKSLYGANTAGLRLTAMDLSECRLLNTHGLDKARIDATVEFGKGPRTAPEMTILSTLDRVTHSKFRILRTLTNYAKRLAVASSRREVLVEERFWRAERKSIGWDTPDHEFNQATPSAQDVQGLYRQLRKSSEDSRNEPGAADFYFGEMEMRRLNSPIYSANRWLLFGYWAVSGYGLRAWRSLLAFVVLLAVSTAALLAFGVGSLNEVYYVPGVSHNGGGVPYLQVSRPTGEQPEPAAVAVLVAQSATSLFRGPTTNVPINKRGEIVVLTLRLLSPILIGLFLLAIRNQVKR